MSALKACAYNNSVLDIDGMFFLVGTPCGAHATRCELPSPVKTVLLGFDRDELKHLLAQFDIS